MFKVILTVVLLVQMSFARAESLQPGVKAFEQTLSITVFNVQKTENIGWSADVFQKLVESSDLVLIQESIDRFPDFKFGRSNYIDYFYKSWGNSSYNTGLTTLTKVPFDEAKRFVSNDKEPVAATPKVTSIEKYSVKGMQKKLAVANTHAINFTGLSAFRRQMTTIANELALHDGPMMWVGDFNTWSTRRKNLLDSLMDRLKLKEVKFKNRSEMFLVLDHAYTRGLEVLEPEQLRLSISDHEPLKFKIKFKKEED